MAPVYRRELFEAFSKLSVEVEHNGHALVVSIPELVAISATLLHRRADSLAEHEDAIRRALDRLFTGF